MGLVRDAYDEMLDELHEENPGALLAGYAGSRLLEEVDPVAYRIGLNDYSDEFICVECGDTFCVDDPWESDGVCDGCIERAEEEEEEDE